uniref:Uncharacterized protein n=1 Tax=Chromera velia CCMP2878 TaxID=1169474 RepID=A0A0G4IB04_9ALVE|eukprot:Cvel_12708.t1-p1 / transcript=Cvel_12708.t1 / gene=Cvel_12708 / organism=Chromera_velia_CCMP2878 / gene_product=hypothetical protein / transcript_product=hypothetical protein / location=Cvel_scaffold843:24526-24879(+) / protein_length=118 / sequence_SO=supercontig / SO=protein_coding / is_pseudo=false
MDDVGLIFPAGGLKKAWEAAVREFATFNLTLNLGKGKSLAFSPDWAKRYGESNTVRWQCPEDPPNGLELSREGFTLGGGGIGTHEFELQRFEEVKKDAVKLTEKVAEYIDPEGSWLLF